MADAPAPASDADPFNSAPQPVIQEPAEPLDSSSDPDRATEPATEFVELAGASLDEPEPVAVPAPTITALEPELTPEPQPTAEPEQRPVVDPVPSVAPPAPVSFNAAPTVAAVVEAPASAEAAGEDGDGGEWDLLLQKLRHWLASGQMQQQWQSARGPLSLVLGLLAVLLVLRVYSALLAVIESLPLVPGLLELAGVIAVGRFTLARLVRSSDRQAVFRDLQQRWQAFRGNA